MISKGEKLLRKVLDFLYPDYVFHDNYRPRWLKRLELDRYYPKLRLAFEYQGIQHYTPGSRWQKTIEDFDQQVDRDEMKKKLCEENQVVLVEVFCWDLGVGPIAQRIHNQLNYYRDWPQAEEIRKVTKNFHNRSPQEKRKLNELCTQYLNPPTRKPKVNKNWSAEIRKAKRDLRRVQAELQN